MKPEENVRRDYELAEDHVSWFFKVIKPLLIEHFVHGYKHGRVDLRNDLVNPTRDD